MLLAHALGYLQEEVINVCTLGALQLVTVVAYSLKVTHNNKAALYMKRFLFIVLVCLYSQACS